MKARIVEKTPERVLTFAVQEPERPGLTAVLKKLAIEERIVTEEELGQEVGYLAGLPGFSKKEAVQAAPACDGVLCMCGFSDGRMDTLLKNLRGAGVNIPIKAVLTATNRYWRFGELIEELAKEHEAMAAARKREQKGGNPK